MQQLFGYRFLAGIVACGAIVLGSAPFTAQAVEVVVKNDSVDQGTSATICPCFAAGESAAVWLTSPCDGTIVAIQVFWRSLTGGSPQSIEDSITIFSAGTFPNPGSVLETLEAPVLTDGVLNEFRYLDENQTIPINVPVTNGQVFVVSLKFFNPSPAFGPSIVFDSNGCQAGKNTVDVQGSGWTSACSLGVTGDWMIRAVVECGDPVGACCFADGSCVDGGSSGDCTSAGGTYQGNGSDCASVTCPDTLGACCELDGSCTDDVSLNTCQAGNGQFQGGGTDCVSNPCPEPVGACCIGGGCLSSTEATCNGASGYYAGNGTTCPSACALGACCFPDGSCSELIQAECVDLGGEYNGSGTVCTPNPCPQPTGACCFSGFCFPNQLEADCFALNPPGAWQGPGSSCTPDPCVGGCNSTAACPDADVNCDNVVSGLDIAIITNSANFGLPTAQAAEPRADVNGDGTVSGLDVAAAQSSACFGQ